MNKLLLATGMLMMSATCFSEGVPAGSYYGEDTILQNSAQSQPNHNGGKIIAYVPGWKTAPAATDLAEAGYTHIIVAFGVFSTITPGQIISAFTTVTPDYIQSLHAAGIKVLLSLGGDSSNIVNTTTDFHAVLAKVSDPECFVEEFVDSMEDMMRQYQFDGFDIHIEHGLSDSGNFTQPTGDIAVLARAMQEIHRKHPEVLLTLAPQMVNIAATQNFQGDAGNYAALVMQTAPILTWVGIQLYNSDAYKGIDGLSYGLDDPNNPDAYVAMATDLLENWPSKNLAGRATGFQPYSSYLDPAQVVLGFPAANQRGVSDGVPAAVTQTVKRAIKCLRTATPGRNSCRNYVAPRPYPNFGGVFEWELSYDQDNHYRFARSLRDCVKFGRCE